MNKKTLVQRLIPRKMQRLIPCTDAACRVQYKHNGTDFFSTDKKRRREASVQSVNKIIHKKSIINQK
jgi:hypothetical protein